MKNLKVSAKLLLGFCIVAALTITVGVVGILSLQDMHISYSDGIIMNGHPLETMGKALTSLQSVRVGVRDALLTRDDETALRWIAADTKANIQEFEALIMDYGQTVSTEQGSALYAEAMREFEDIYKPAVLKILEEIEAGTVPTEEQVEQLALTEVATANMVNQFNALMTINIEALETLNIKNSALSDTLFAVTLSIGIISAGLAVFLGFYLSKLISIPLITLAAFMKRASTTGDLSLSPEDHETIRTQSVIKDEIGQAISGCAAFVMHIITIAKELETLARGNLTVDIEALSESDTLGVSLIQMKSNLNKMFGDVSSSANQVSAGAKQVANGSQSLAQGATEQAAAIQQLSASIGDIAEKTKENAATAEKTSKLSEIIRENAEKGSRQMDEMMTAVKDINDASQSISKIIKTIDDIAFQTNILALNAAVEAARAGQHGKGFAVVAEEVRNLAAKSAEAAKETGLMIQNTMDKAEFGSGIATQTASSLAEIVTGINESSALITEFAQSSEAQAIWITQINTGIDQVAQVIQQNSATAEESAAASQQMSSQSMVLQELMSEFKLRDTANEQIENDTGLVSFDLNRVKRSA